MTGFGIWGGFPEVDLAPGNNKTASAEQFSGWISGVEFLCLQLFQAESVGTVQSFSSFTDRPAICLSAPTVRNVYRKRAIWLSPDSLRLSASTLSLPWFFACFFFFFFLFYSFLAFNSRIFNCLIYSIWGPSTFLSSVILLCHRLQQFHPLQTAIKAFPVLFNHWSVLFFMWILISLCRRWVMHRITCFLRVFVCSSMFVCLDSRLNFGTLSSHYRHNGALIGGKTGGWLVKSRHGPVGFPC